MDGLSEQEKWRLLHITMLIDFHGRKNRNRQYHPVLPVPVSRGKNLYIRKAKDRMNKMDSAGAGIVGNVYNRLSYGVVVNSVCGMWESCTLLFHVL